VTREGEYCMTTPCMSRNNSESQPRSILCLIALFLLGQGYSRALSETLLAPHPVHPFLNAIIELFCIAYSVCSLPCPSMLINALLSSCPCNSLLLILEQILLHKYSMKYSTLDKWKVVLNLSMFYQNLNNHSLWLCYLVAARLRSLSINFNEVQKYHALIISLLKKTTTSLLFPSFVRNAKKERKKLVLVCAGIEPTAFSIQSYLLPYPKSPNRTSKYTGRRGRFIGDALPLRQRTFSHCCQTKSLFCYV